MRIRIFSAVIAALLLASAASAQLLGPGREGKPAKYTEKYGIKYFANGFDTARTYPYIWRKTPRHLERIGAPHLIDRFQRYALWMSEGRQIPAWIDQTVDRVIQIERERGNARLVDLFPWTALTVELMPDRFESGGRRVASDHEGLHLRIANIVIEDEERPEYSGILYFEGLLSLELQRLVEGQE